MIAADNEDLIVIYEKLLLARATAGIRPVLYVSSPVDLQCAILMLLPLKQGQASEADPPLLLTRAHR